MRIRLLTAVVIATTLAMLASCCRPPEPPEPTAVPTPRLFTLVGTADLQGQLDPTTMELDLDGDGVKEERSVGGIARIATLIRALERERPGRVAVVSVGDDLMNRYFHTFKGRAIFELMSAAGFEIYAFGNHEFDKGPQVLAEALGHASFECVCTDLAVDGTALDGLCAPLIIEDYEGLSVGYFSVMTEGFPYVTSGENVKLTGANVDVARDAIARLREQGADLIVGLTHIGLDEDVKLAAAVPGIDIIFGGHSHEYTTEPVRVGRTVIVNGGEKGPYLVRLDITVEPDGGFDPDAVRCTLVQVTDDVAAAPDVDVALGGYRESFPEAIVLGRTDVQWDMTKAALREGESCVANLVNDRMREKFAVDVVLNNAGAFRGKKIYEPGPVTDAMLHEIDEFSNYAYAMDLDGDRILEVLERSAANFGEGGLLHASGLRYTIDLSRKSQIVVHDEAAGWSIEEPGERVLEAEVLGADGGWSPLDPGGTYRVLSNSFLVNHAGDGYFWFKQYGRDQVNTYSTFYSILAEIAGKEGVLNPEEPDGRLTVVGR